MHYLFTVCQSVWLQGLTGTKILLSPYGCFIFTLSYSSKLCASTGICWIINERNLLTTSRRSALFFRLSVMENCAPVLYITEAASHTWLVSTGNVTSGSRFPNHTFLQICIHTKISPYLWPVEIASLYLLNKSTLSCWNFFYGTLGLLIFTYVSHDICHSSPGIFIFLLFLPPLFVHRRNASLLWIISLFQLCF